MASERCTPVEVCAVWRMAVAGSVMFFTKKFDVITAEKQTIVCLAFRAPIYWFKFESGRHPWYSFTV
jgi:hypothetical protein